MDKYGNIVKMKVRMHRMVKRFLVFISWGACLLAASGGARLHGQDAAAIAARLKEAQSLNSIDAEGLHPWHLKLNMKFYNGTALVSEEGTVEEWWGGPGKQRVTYNLPSYQGTILRLGKEEYRTKSLGSAPIRAEGLLAQVVHPMANSDIEGSKPDLRKQKFGKVQLDCIMLDQQLKNVAFPPFGLFPTYCLDPGEKTLRISYDVGSDVYLRNGRGAFQGRVLATQITLQVGEARVATAEVAALTTFKPAESEFTPPADMEEEHEEAALVSPGIIDGTAIHKDPPRYPEAAKLRRSSGQVVLGAVIGRDGQVRSLRLISSPDADLAIASIAAVKHWTYKPYYLDGRPVDVQTRITVNFSFGR